MLEFADRPVDVHQLNLEIDALGLPGVKGVSQLSRRRDAKGVLRSVAPYILVKVEGLSAAQEAQVAAVVAAHVPASQPTPQEEARERYLAVVIANKDIAPWGAVLYDLAIADGLIEA